jgi:3-oxoacyl-[acyl-carrier-protein] synthase III
MVTELACDAGLTPDQLYFNIESVGNVSAASIPIAIHDAVSDGVIDRPMRVFAPGFGAGAVGGYAVLRIDPGVAAPAAEGAREHASTHHGNGRAGSSAQDVYAAFGD